MSSKLEKAIAKAEKAWETFCTERDIFLRNGDRGSFKAMQAADRAYERANYRVAMLKINGE